MPTVILCVNNDHTALTVRNSLLSTAGNRVLTADHPEAALRLFTCNHVDLVITDHLVPNETGVDAIAEMKRLKPEVPAFTLVPIH